MRRHLAALILAVAIATVQAGEVVTTVRGPLSYSLQEYGLVLSVSMLGGLVEWLHDIRSGRIPVAPVAALLGTWLASVMAGLMCFWLCEWQGFNQLLTIALVALSGRAGDRVLKQAERLAQRWIDKRAGAFGISGPVPLDEERKP